MTKTLNHGKPLKLARGRPRDKQINNQFLLLMATVAYAIIEGHGLCLQVCELKIRQPVLPVDDQCDKFV